MEGDVTPPVITNARKLITTPQLYVHPSIMLPLLENLFPPVNLYHATAYILLVKEVIRSPSARSLDAITIITASWLATLEYS
jgi:hypothetical protein